MYWVCATPERKALPQFGARISPKECRADYGGRLIEFRLILKLRIVTHVRFEKFFYALAGEVIRQADLLASTASVRLFEVNSIHKPGHVDAAQIVHCHIGANAGPENVSGALRLAFIRQE